MGLISKIRNIKSSLKIEPKNTVTLFVDKKLTSKFINNETEIIISNLARVEISFSILKKKHNEKHSKFIYKNIPFNISYKSEDVPSISDAKDLLMMNKELDAFEFEIKRIETKLKNKSFLEKAPEKVVVQFKNQEQDIKSSIEKIEQIINTIN